MSKCIADNAPTHNMWVNSNRSRCDTELQSRVPCENQPRPASSEGEDGEMQSDSLKTLARRRALQKLRAERGNAPEPPIDRSHFWKFGKKHKPRPILAIKFTTPKRRAIWGKTAGRCFYCGLQTLGPGVGFSDEKSDCYMVSPFATWMEGDHYVSKKLGGGNGIENLVPSCPDCNNLKRGFAVADFRRLFTAKHGSPFFYGEIAS